MFILLENVRFFARKWKLWKQKIEWHLRFWPYYWKMKVCYEVYNFELNWLIIHLRNYEAFFALCLYLLKNIEIWCLALLLKTGNIVHELVTESFTNQKTRLTIVHERLFSINRLVPLHKGTLWKSKLAQLLW
jgi:hypothetical protein